MTSSDFDDILREVRAGEVAARPCAGVAVGDEPRHPRPAGTRLTMMALYAVDYQGREPDGGMADMDLRPMLDLIAAQYAGCDACQAKQTATVADNPALLTHLIGVALCSLTSISEQVSARLLLQKVDPPGAAIAITMRSVGLLAAVDVAASLSADDRRSAVGAFPSE